MPRVRRFPLAADVEVGAYALDGSRSLGLPGSPQLGQIFVGDAQVTRSEVHLRFDAIAVAALLRGEIGLQRESGRPSFQQRRQPAGTDGEGFEGVSAYRQRTAKRVKQGARGTHPGVGLDRVQQIALAHGIGPEQHGQPRQIDGDVT